MKSIIANSLRLLCPLALGIFQLYAQQSTPPPDPSGAPEPRSSGPAIQFEAPLLDFGQVTAGELVKHSFVFTNTGEAVLVVTNVRPACGCTTAGEWTRIVQPGETGIVPVQFNSSSFNGPVLKYVTVTCNDKAHPSVILQLKGTVWRPIEVQPSFAVLNLPEGSQTNVSATLHITNHLDAPVTLSAPELNNKAFSAELKTIVPGKEFQVIVSAMPPFEGAGKVAQLTLRTSCTNLPVIVASILANVQRAHVR